MKLLWTPPGHSESKINQTADELARQARKNLFVGLEPACRLSNETIKGTHKPSILSRYLNVYFMRINFDHVPVFLGKTFLVALYLLFFFILFNFFWKNIMV